MNDHLVPAQLDLILRHPVFARAARMRELLSYLVNEELAGRGALLTGYRVAVEGLGKPEDFDPSSDASARVEVGRLRRMLTQYFAEAQQQSPLVITIPKGSYRPRFEARETAGPGPSDRFVVVPSAGPAVAILEFEFDADSEEQLLLATGLREELLSELFRYREFHFVDASGLTPREDATAAERCAHELECEYMLAGRLTPARNTYHLRLSVTDLQRLNPVWTGSFDIPRDTLDVIESASRIAGQVANELARPTGAIGIAAIKKRLLSTPGAWTATDCILRWHLYRLRDRGPETHLALRERVGDLLRRDPGFAMGYVMYALLKIDEVVYRLNPEGPAGESLTRAAYLVNQALGTDPDNAVAHYVKAQCHYFSREFDDFRATVERTLALHPRNSDLLQQCGTFLCFHGQWQRGQELVEQAGMRYHPGVGYRLAHLVIEYFTNDDPTPGRRLLETSYLPPTLSVGHIVACLVRVKCGDLEEAGRLLRRAHEVERSLNRGLEDLVRLWFTDPDLIDTTLDDLRRVQARTGIVRALN